MRNAFLSGDDQRPTRNSGLAAAIGALQADAGGVEAGFAAGMDDAERPVRTDALAEPGELGDPDGMVDLVLRPGAPAAQRHHGEADAARVDRLDQTGPIGEDRRTIGARGKCRSGCSSRSAGPPSAAIMWMKRSAAAPLAKASSILATASSRVAASRPSSSISAAEGQRDLLEARRSRRRPVRMVERHIATSSALPAALKRAAGSCR
jgi:hypothetical protein